jgi:hypothetical protein
MMEDVLAALQRQAGPRGATFLGRRVAPGMTLEDVMRDLPQQELESAGSMKMIMRDPTDFVTGMTGWSLPKDPLSMVGTLLSRPVRRMGAMKMGERIKERLDEY